MKFLAILLRYFSIAFSLICGLFMTGVSFVLLVSSATNFRLDMVPFLKGTAALYAVLALGLFGVLAAALAFLKKLKFLLVAFTVVLLGAMIYGYFVSPVYRFSGAAEAKTTAWLAFAAVGAFFGSLMQFERPKRG